MPCQTQHTRYLCSIFYLNVPSSSSEETLSVLKLHSTEAGTSSTLCTSARNLNAHFLIYLWDRGRGKGVVKGQGWRECGAQRISIHPPLYYSMNATGDRARLRSIIFYSIKLQQWYLPLFMPLQSSILLYITMFHYWNWWLVHSKFWSFGDIYWHTLISRSQRVSTAIHVVSPRYLLATYQKTLSALNRDSLFLELKGNTGKSVNSVNCFGYLHTAF